MKILKFSNLFENKSDDKLEDLAELMYDKYKETLTYYYNNPDKLKEDYKLHNSVTFDTQPEDKKKVDYKWAKKVLNILKGDI